MQVNEDYAFASCIYENLGLNSSIFDPTGFGWLPLCYSCLPLTNFFTEQTYLVYFLNKMVFLNGYSMDLTWIHWLCQSLKVNLGTQGTLGLWLAVTSIGQDNCHLWLARRQMLSKFFFFFLKCLNHLIVLASSITVLYGKEALCKYHGTLAQSMNSVTLTERRITE